MYDVVDLQYRVLEYKEAVKNEVDIKKTLRLLDVIETMEAMIDENRAYAI